MLEMINLMIDYHYTLFEKIWQSLDTLSEEQFVQEVDYSQGSLRNHMVHMAGVDGRWLRGLKGLPDPRSYKPAAQDYPTRAVVRALWLEVAREVRAYVAALDETALSQKPPRMEEPAWQILLHLVNHGTDHRAQMLRLLHDLGAPTFPQDLAFYLWEKAKGKN